jgi:hypothetical protein
MPLCAAPQNAINATEKQHHKVHKVTRQLSQRVAHLWLSLSSVQVIHLANASAEHDGFDILTPLTVGQPLAKAACKAMHNRLTELVAVVTGTVTGADSDVQRLC